ncbi:hypothetical protein F4808DRAFT_476067 [Astrocystis sublimbata]|nr:hypothetical protein F4808DRAFT_476067 [Astrocystis sublimbata]
MALPSPQSLPIREMEIDDDMDDDMDDSQHDAISQDGLASSQWDSKDSPNLLRLMQVVRNNAMRGGLRNNEEFLSNNKIDELVTKESVLLALQDTELPNEKHEDLANWVLESGSKPLFLILVMMTGFYGKGERLSRLGHMKEAGICRYESGGVGRMTESRVGDWILPLEGDEGVNPWERPSMPAYRQPGSARRGVIKESFDGWETIDIEFFKHVQWYFLTPVLGVRPLKKLSSREALPFVNMRKTEEGIFWSGKVTLEHIPSSEDVIWSGEIPPGHFLSSKDENKPNSQAIPVLVKKFKSWRDMKTSRYQRFHAGVGTFPGLVEVLGEFTKDGAGYLILHEVVDGAQLTGEMVGQSRGMDLKVQNQAMLDCWIGATGHDLTGHPAPRLFVTPRI